MKIVKKIACAAWLILLASCGSNREYWHALPEQSAAVVSIDLPKLATRAGLDGKQGESATNRLKDMVKSGLAGSSQLVDRIFADVTESGVDFRDKLYLFSSDENAVLGLLAKVTSRSKLEHVIESLGKEQLCQPIRSTDGCNWTVLGKWLLAFSDNALLVLSDNKWSDPSTLVRQASMWLRQEEGQGFSTHADFNQLQLTKSDISLWTSMNLLPRKVLTPITMGLSAELDLKKIKAITTLNFESGKIIMEVNPLITDRIVSHLADKQAEAIDKIQGNHLDLFPAKTSFWTTAHLKGQQFYQFLREIPAVRKFFDHSDLPITLDYGRIFEAVEGDVSFTITDAVREEFILYADVKQTEFLKFFTELRPMIAKTNGLLLFEERGENAYCFATHDGTVMNLRPGVKIFWLGVKDGRFYFTNKEDLVNQRVLGLSLRNKEWGKRVPGMKFFAISDWKSLNTFAAFMQNDLLKNIPQNVTNRMNSVTLESKDGHHLKLTIELHDKNKNIIESLFHM